MHPETGLPLLHYAVGSDRLKIMKVLLERGAKAVPDRNGRWPSILALQCECSDEVCDLIEAAESSKLSYRFFIDIPEAIPVGRIRLAREIGPNAEVSIDRGGTVRVMAGGVTALSNALNVLNYMLI